MKLHDKARAILESKTFAHVGAVDADGRPHVTPVWVDTDKDTVWFNTARGRMKERLLTRGAPTAISAVNPENPTSTCRSEGG